MKAISLATSTLISQARPQTHAPTQGKPSSAGRRGRVLTWHDHGRWGGRVCAQAETPAFGQPVAQHGDVLLQSGRVFGFGQLAAEVQSLLLGALRQAGLQEVGDSGIHRLFPALEAKAHFLIYEKVINEQSRHLSVN